MQTDYYVLAHGQATNDRAELRVQIEKLLARDAKLEQLIEILKEFIPAPEPVEGTSAATNEAAASEDNHHGEAPVHESHEHEHAGA